MTLRILLADDHDVVRRGLKELLEEQVGWTVCAEAANGREAVELAIETRPQVAVLDFSMPELNGLCAMGAGGIAGRREFKLTELASVGGLVTRRIDHLEMLAAVSSQSLRLASGHS